MGWRDRAVPVATDDAPVSGWRSRAVPVSQEEAPEEPGFLDKLGLLIGDIKSSPAYSTTPSALLEGGYEKLTEATGKAGERVEEALSTPGSQMTLPSGQSVEIGELPPIVPKAAGKLVEFAPDILTGVGPLGPAITKGNRLTEGVAGKLESIADYAAGKSAGFTKGMRKKIGRQETRAMGRILRQGTEGAPPVVSATADTADMTARALALKEKAGGRIGTILKNLDKAQVHKPDVARILEDLKPGIAEVKGLRAAAPTMNQYRKVLVDVKRYGRKPTYEGLQRLKKAYKELAFPGGNKAAEGVKGYKDAYFAISRELEKSADEGVELLASNIPQTRLPLSTFTERQKAIESVGQIPEIYRGAKQQYGASKAALEGLRDKAAGEDARKFLGLTDIIVGTGGLSTAVATGNPAMALSTVGLVGAKKAVEHYGPQTIAVGSQKLADLVRNSPNLLGQFAPLLANALERGSDALASTDFILQQTDPEYRKMRTQMDKEANPQ